MRAADRIRDRRGRAAPLGGRTLAPRRVGDEAEGALPASAPTAEPAGETAGQAGTGRAIRETSRGWQQ